MLSCTLMNTMLTDEERALFEGCLAEQGVDGAIWGIYACALRVPSKTTETLVLRAYDGERLVAAAFVVKCRAWGKAVFDFPLLYKAFDLPGLSAIVWIRVGFCAEGVANPGFVVAPLTYDDVVPAMLEYLRGQAYGLIVVDRVENDPLHRNVQTFPYVNDGTVSVKGMGDVSEYVGSHRNIVRKIKEFENRGGQIEVVRGALDERLIRLFRGFVTATVEKSLIYSPFQDIFGDLVAETCASTSERMVHFVASMKGEPLGYHTFVQTGRGLRMIHGAFDRERRTTHHCYENLIIANARYAIEAGLDCVYLGPVVNETKRRMVNVTEGARLHFGSGYWVIRTFFGVLFPYTKMQRKELGRFSR